MSISVQAGSTASSARTATGSLAQQEYRQAVKDLATAQRTLAKHAAEGAGEDTLDLDKTAVQLAAAAVARAAAAVAREQQEARQRVEQRAQDRGAARSGAAGTAPQDVAAVGVTVDVYA